MLVLLSACTPEQVADTNTDNNSAVAQAAPVVTAGNFPTLALAKPNGEAATTSPASNPNPTATPEANIKNTSTAVPIPTVGATIKTLANDKWKPQPVVPLPWAGRGLLQDQTFYSPILNRNVTYRIYLPPGYRGTDQSYPVLYMLHGLSGSYKEWTDYGLLNYSDDMIADGTIPPYIIVLPEGDQDYWMNHANGGLRWADYVAYDVVGYIDAHYRTIPNRANRAIGGQSMGGQGSLQIAFNYPQVFSIVGAHSPTLRSKAQAFYYWGDDQYYATVDPVSLAQTKDLSSYKIWLDIGESDTDWRPRTEELHNILVSKGANVEWHLWPGTHGGEYWIAHVKDYIKFYANAFPVVTPAKAGS
jgi:enterochelin esterase-like enzyme